MQANTLRVLEMCISEGITYGLNRAYKHTDNPKRDYIMQCIEDEITTALHEWFIFEEKNT